ncbi:MAG TPA: hypothetical protein VKX49_26535 [Bryobacteraceae bacterium]|nr:hypothetical protein [Bryobacteraceae bacterium]
MTLHIRIVSAGFAGLLTCSLASAQDAPAATPAPQSASAPAPVNPDPPPAQSAQDQPPPDKRVFGVLPNYRTANDTGTYTPITIKQKFAIASKDSFDYPLVLLAGAIAGLGQLTDQNPSFGQGMAGYGRRLGTGYADQAIGNMMTEAIFPSFLREDPRYFRRGRGGNWSRAWYAATRVFVTRTDEGKWRFNYSEVLGNATAVAISNAYYPDGRDATDNAIKLAEQIGIDSVSQVLKEFWPDIKHRLFQRHGDTADTAVH